MVSPTATTQSSGDQEPLQRITKKTKRDCESIEIPMSTPPVEIVQETLMSTGLPSQDSNQWRTLVKTPNNVWGRKETNEATEKEIVSDDEVMDEDNMDSMANVPRYSGD